MIEVTNDIKRFLEKETGEIIIYGAGNAGYWVGYYMNRCGIDFSCYVDKKIQGEEGAFYNDKPVYSPKKLNEYKGRSIRIIITPQQYEQILAGLLICEKDMGFNALCCIPSFVHQTTKVEGYHINKFLAYFRRKLFKGEIPTIISNDCSAGYIYHIMDMIMISPTINTGIDQDDFIKLCRNTRHYAQQKVGGLHWERAYGNPQTDKDVLAGNVDDIKVCFAHVDSETEIQYRWETMCKMINWDRIIYVANSYDRNIPPFTVRNEKEFLNLPGEKLMMVDRNTACWCNGGFNKIYMKENYLSRRDTAIENYFDLLGWLNKEYQEI